MKAFVVQGNRKAGIETVPVPAIDDNDVLVHVVAVGQNPTDWKCKSAGHIEPRRAYAQLRFSYAAVKLSDRAGVICGCDYSGYVVKIGKDVTLLSVGDHVAGFTHGSIFKDRGAFAEYLKIAEDLAFKVPEGTLSHEEAATLGGA